MESGKMLLQLTGYIRYMNNKKIKKFFCQKNGVSYEVQEDLVGWYLYVFSKQSHEISSEDFLFDTLEDALSEAKKRFNIPIDQWEMVIEGTRYY